MTMKERLGASLGAAERFMSFMIKHDSECFK